MATHSTRTKNSKLVKKKREINLAISAHSIRVNKGSLVTPDTFFFNVLPGTDCYFILKPQGGALVGV